MDPYAGRRPMAFLIRVQRLKNGFRGQVVVVTTGASRLFEDLHDAVRFIEAQLDERDGPSLAEEGGSHGERA